VRERTATSRLQAWVLAGCLVFSSAMPTLAQRDRRDDRDHRGNYYNGMHDRVRQGDYERYSRDDEERHHHHDSGGIGPGKAALIGGGGGAALGVLFGGGLKGTLIGGAAGAGLGALGGKLAEGDDNNHHRDRHDRH
jgi:hypothetical protein